MASTTFDLPDPFGPTTTVTPGSNWSVVGSANDLKPLRVSDFKNTAGPTLVASTPPPREPPAHPAPICRRPRPTSNDLGATLRQRPHSLRPLGTQIAQKGGGRGEIQDLGRPFGDRGSDSSGHCPWRGDHLTPGHT